MHIFSYILYILANKYGTQMGTMESGKWKAHWKKFCNFPLICSDFDVTYNFFNTFLSKYWIIDIEPCQRQSQKISEELQNFFQGAFHFPLSISPICVPKILPNFLIFFSYLPYIYTISVFVIPSTCFPHAFHVLSIIPYIRICWFCSFYAYFFIYFVYSC